MNDTSSGRLVHTGSATLPALLHAATLGRTSPSHRGRCPLSRTKVTAVTAGFSMAGRSSASNSGCRSNIDRHTLNQTNVSPGVPGELRAHVPQLARADDHHVGRLRAQRQLPQQAFTAVHAGRDPSLTVLRPQQPQEHRGEEHQRDHRQDLGLDHVKKVQHDGDDGRQHASDGVPLDPQHAVHSGRASMTRIVAGRGRQANRGEDREVDEQFQMLEAPGKRNVGAESSRRCSGAPGRTWMSICGKEISMPSRRNRCAMAVWSAWMAGRRSSTSRT